MRTRSALVFLLPLLASCSLALSKGPPADWRSAEARDPAALDSCDPTPTWGFVDTALSAVSLAAGYIASSGRLGPDEDRGEHILIGMIGAGFFGFGAAVGYKRADACEDFLRELPRSGAGSQPAPDPGSPRAVASEDREFDPSMITADELSEGTDATLMAAVQRLRPQWLRRTGVRNTLPGLIVNDQAVELDRLDTLLPQDVEWLRFLQPSDATLRWGTGYPSGAIEVRTRR